MKDLSELIKREINTPSPIREIMKMAERNNIINMGLNPDDVISFAGGWVDHLAPEDLRTIYGEIAGDLKEFHKSGGYSPTSGFDETKDAVAEFEKTLFNEKLEKENIIIGGSSSQMTMDLFRVLLNKNDRIILPDPTYANYFGQIRFVSDTIKIESVQFLNEEWKFLENKRETLERIGELFKENDVKAMLVASPDNPTSQILPHDFVKEIIKMGLDTGTYVIFDFAYKTQYFSEIPEYFSYSPLNYENIIAIHSNSKWDRGLGRRMGWVEADEEIVKAMERAQQVSILCPDTLHQMAFTAYVKKSGKSIKKYVDDVRFDYKKAALETVSSIKEFLGFRYLEPQGGLYVSADVGMDSDRFVVDVMKNTGVLFVPGKGFGKSMEKGIRISYGPLVRDKSKIREGIGRVGKYLNGRGNS